MLLGRGTRNQIVIKGAREHNLANIDLALEKNKLIAFAGVSGSGKSTLAFDTIYAEAQRRYLESLSSYARQFLEQLKKPELDGITGLSPAVALEQKQHQLGPRSTVGTITEILDYLRLLFTHVGRPYCHEHNRYILRQTIQNMADEILSWPEGTRLQFFAPVARNQSKGVKALVRGLHKQGFVRLRVNGEIFAIDEEDIDVSAESFDIDVVFDRIILKEGISGRIAEALEGSLKLGNGRVIVWRAAPGSFADEVQFNERFACPDCGTSFPELEPALFSFNSPSGACPHCHGLGHVFDVVESTVISNKDLSLKDGAAKPWALNRRTDAKYRRALKRLCQDYGYDYETPWRKLPSAFQQIILFGEQGTKINSKRKKRFEGVIPNVKRRYYQTSSSYVRKMFGQFLQEQVCPECSALRLRKETLAVYFCGKNIAELCSLPLSELTQFFEQAQMTKQEIAKVDLVLREIKARLRFLLDLGLDYLTLARGAATLSGGEAQRIRLASQIGSGLSGVIYVLDEPSIGLHARDNAKLLANLLHLRDLGNTIIVVEHDKEILKASEQIVELGPMAGREGGKLVAQGTVAEIARDSNSLTGQYLSGKLTVAQNMRRDLTERNFLEIVGAELNNLKQIHAALPIGALSCVTGVSGSGKSSLILETLYPALANMLNGQNMPAGKALAMRGFEYLDKVISIDQSPIGKTPRSNPATYSGFFTLIREVFAQLSESQVRGYKSGRFSFNVKGGRCETCKGDGQIAVGMHFLPDVFVPCPDCQGRRYNRETLEIKYRGLNISEVLELSVTDALNYFHAFPNMVSKLQTLQKVGLGYIKLGQAGNTLSGGEAQRVKLATELARKSTGKTLYLLDEPTTGLHAYDIKQLLQILQELVEQGNTVVIIEHNLDVIASADWIIDLGPEGGDKGGEIVAQGPIGEIISCRRSYTGQALRS
ncbi:MAG: excinuclease ABC subunit UvrA [Deltaproteobacteria bacterium]|nr:excinuclease ABC subunit UvrA [Deltaproteobacteria bacterium]